MKLIFLIIGLCLLGCVENSKKDNTKEKPTNDTVDDTVEKKDIIELGDTLFLGYRIGMDWKMSQANSNRYDFTFDKETFPVYIKTSSMSNPFKLDQVTLNQTQCEIVYYEQNKHYDPENTMKYYNKREGDSIGSIGDCWKDEWTIKILNLYLKKYSFETHQRISKFQECKEGLTMKMLSQGKEIPEPIPVPDAVTTVYYNNKKHIIIELKNEFSCSKKRMIKEIKVSYCSPLRYKVLLKELKLPTPKSNREIRINKKEEKDRKLIENEKDQINNI